MDKIKTTHFPLEKLQIFNNNFGYLGGAVQNLQNTKADASALTGFVPTASLATPLGVATLDTAGSLVQAAPFATEALYAVRADDYNPVEGTIKDKFGDIGQDIAYIKAGKQKAYVFDTQAKLETWLSDPTNVAKLNIGDNLYVRALNEPDFWWDGTKKLPLGADTVDLTNVWKKTDTIPGSSIGGGIPAENIQGELTGAIIPGGNIIGYINGQQLSGSVSASLITGQITADQILQSDMGNMAQGKNERAFVMSTGANTINFELWHNIAPAVFGSLDNAVIPGGNVTGAINAGQVQGYGANIQVAGGNITGLTEITGSQLTAYPNIVVTDGNGISTHIPRDKILEGLSGYVTAPQVGPGMFQPGVILPPSQLGTGAINQYASVSAAQITTGALQPGVTLAAGQIGAGTLASNVSVPAGNVGAGTLTSTVVVPIANLTTGALKANITLPAAQVTTGTLVTGVTMSATQLTTGTLAAGVTVPQIPYDGSISGYGQLVYVKSNGQMGRYDIYNLNNILSVAPGLMQTGTLNEYVTVPGMNVVAQTIYGGDITGFNYVAMCDDNGHIKKTYKSILNPTGEAINYNNLQWDTTGFPEFAYGEDIFIPLVTEGGQTVGAVQISGLRQAMGV